MSLFEADNLLEIITLSEADNLLLNLIISKDIDFEKIDNKYYCLNIILGFHKNRCGICIFNSNEKGGLSEHKIKTIDKILDILISVNYYSTVSIYNTNDIMPRTKYYKLKIDGNGVIKCKCVDQAGFITNDVEIDCFNDLYIIYPQYFSESPQFRD